MIAAIFLAAVLFVVALFFYPIVHRTPTYQVFEKTGALTIVFTVNDATPTEFETIDAIGSSLVSHEGYTKASRQKAVQSPYIELNVKVK